MEKEAGNIKEKEFYFPNELNWSWLEQVSLVEVMGPYLPKVFINNGVRITYSTWRRLFQLQEPVYRELCLEIYVIVTLWGGNDYYNKNTLTFYLGGEYRECSIVELAWRMGLYDQAKVKTEAFGEFLHSFHKDFPDGVNETNWRSTITNGVYIPSAAQDRCIKSPVHRLIHRFISCSINMRKDEDKMPNHDVFYLWSIIMSNTFCNIPYCLEKY